MKLNPRKSLLVACGLLSLGAMASQGFSQVQTAENLLVDLDATVLATGQITFLTNNGTVGGGFEAIGGGANAPKIIAVGGNGTMGIRFDGNDFMQHVAGPGGALVPAPDGVVGLNPTRSIEVWVFNVTVPSEETLVAFGKRGGPNGSNLSFNYGTSGAFGAVGHWGGADIGWVNAGGAPAAGGWHHLVYTYDGTTTRVYVDGVLANSETLGSGAINTHTGTPITLAAQLNSAGAVDPGMRGSLVMGKVRVHDGALSDTQVAANFNLEKGQFLPGTPTPLSTGPIHRYTFNNAASNNATNLVVEDIIGSADGVVKSGGGAVTFTGSMLTLSGGASATAPYVDLPNGLLSSLSADAGGSGQATVEGWITIRASRSWARIFDFGSTTAGELTEAGGSGNGADDFFLSGQNGTDLTIRRFDLANNDTVGGGVPGATTLDYGSYSLGQPLHFAITWDESTGAITIYENGVEVASGVTDKRMSNINDVNVWLGRSNWTADNNVQGDFDDFRIYNRILNPQEVLQDFQAGPDSVFLEPGPLQSIAIVPARAQMMLGTFQQASARANYLNVTNVQITSDPGTVFFTSDTNVVAISTGGNIQAIGVGTATIFASFSGLTNSATVTVTPITATLTHRYSFDADANDSIGTNHGTLQSGATLANGSVQFEATQKSHVLLPAGLYTGYDALTVEAWASFGVNSGWTRLFDFGDTNPGSSVGRNYLFFSPHTGPADTRISISDADPGYNHEEAVARAGVLDGQTNVHIVAIFHPLARTISFYINGSLGAIRSDITIPLSSTADLLNYIGKSVYPGDAGLNASVDEFRIYNGVLTPEKIALNAAAGPNSAVSEPGALQSLKLNAAATMVQDGIQQLGVTGDFANVTGVNLSTFSGVAFTSSAPAIVKVDASGLATAAGLGSADLIVSYGGLQATQSANVVRVPLIAKHRYSFGELTGSDIAEDTISQANGLVSGGAAFDELGHLTLDGTNGYVDLPNGIISTLSNVTIEAWFTPTSAQNWVRVFDFGVSNNGENGQGTGENYLFLSSRGNNGPRFTAKATGGGEQPVLEPTGQLPLSQESHVVVVYNVSGGVARLYINGQLQASGAVTIPLNAINDVNNWLGRSQFSTDSYFAGQLNEFRIYDGVMLPGQVAASYTAGPDAAVGLSLQVIRNAEGTFTVMWPASASDYFLESSATLGASASWQSVDAIPVEEGGFLRVTVPTTGNAAFFRLSK